jgi:bifunctional UDP-N-acetylglucosamine pyrophosphorylase/glucosamine-1-phosphate N-acetyltransferase
MIDSSKVGAIILAGGRGKRMQSTSTNKTASLLGNKPMVKHIVEFMQRIKVGQIIVVVGFARDSVEKALDGIDVTYAEQTEQLGTGHAVEVAMNSLHPTITDVVVVYGDDAVLYNGKNSEIVADLIEKHQASKNALTFLTIEQDNPQGLGRIVRGENGETMGIVEEKNATDEQRKITEINPGCFVFSVEFLKKYLQNVGKNELSGEYYLTDLVDIARTNHQPMSTVEGGKLLWRGVNTPEELAQAENLLSQT